MANWEDRNPRNDYKSIPWFRMDADFFQNKKLFTLAIEDRWRWACLLGLAAKENKGGVIDAEPEWIASQLNVPQADLFRLIETLEKKGLLTTNVPSTSDVRDTNVERSYERNERDELFGEDEKGPIPSPRALVELWNTHKGEKQPKVLASTFKPNSPRWNAARARLKDVPDLAYWEEVIKRIGASDFCNGKGGTGWIASFAFLIQVESHIKAMEGTYDNKKSAKQQPSMKVFTAEDFPQ